MQFTSDWHFIMKLNTWNVFSLSGLNDLFLPLLIIHVFAPCQITRFTLYTCLFFLLASWGCPLTFSSTPIDNVIMVRESLLSNVSPPCDERTLREHVKHHTPEHLSVSVSDPISLP